MAASSRGTSSSSSRARKPTRPDRARPGDRRRAVQVPGPDRGRQRRRAARREPGDDAGEHVARARGAETRAAGRVGERLRPSAAPDVAAIAVPVRSAQRAQARPAAAAPVAAAQGGELVRVRRQHGTSAERLQQRRIVRDHVDARPRRGRRRTTRRSASSTARTWSPTVRGSPSSPGPTSTASASSQRPQHARAEVASDRQPSAVSGTPITRASGQRHGLGPRGARRARDLQLAGTGPQRREAREDRGARPSRAEPADHQHAPARLLVVVVGASAAAGAPPSTSSLAGRRRRGVSHAPPARRARASRARPPRRAARRRCRRRSRVRVAAARRRGRDRRSSASSSPAPSRGRCSSTDGLVEAAPARSGSS